MGDEYFLLNETSAVDYIKNKSCFFDKDEKLDCKEIGDGNINYVFLLKSENKSIVLKQADKNIRTSGRFLDTKRIYIESETLKLQSQYSCAVPKIYFYDDVMHVVAMEDISDYKNMRKELMDGKIFPEFDNQITDYLADVLLPTTDLMMDRHEKKRAVKKFINIQMCDISEDLVFTEPYNNYKNRNIVLEKNKDYIIENIYNNSHLHAIVAELRNDFMNNAQALIHGDLHTASIFIKENGIKIIDPEFAFYGPIAYDIGNIIGNLYFSLYYNEIVQKRKDVYEYIQRSIFNIVVYTKKKMERRLKENVNTSIYNDEYIQKYVNTIISQSLRYAGTEMIRRVVGDSKVEEISSVEDVDIRAELERNIINRALLLLC